MNVRFPFVVALVVIALIALIPNAFASNIIYGGAWNRYQPIDPAQYLEANEGQVYESNQYGRVYMYVVDGICYQTRNIQYAIQQDPQRVALMTCAVEIIK